ncbi:MAG: DUF2764 family protein [Candidatus Omnitrophota bacterium]
MLHFGAKPPFTFAKFLEICQDKIPESDAGIIKSLAEGYASEVSHPALKRWRDFDTGLRNELVKIRAARKHVDYLKYIRGDEYIEPYITHIAMSAYRAPSIPEAERLLDWERWRILDELAAGHYFDLDFLIIYALKLLILERWERINSADKPRLLEEVLN